MPGPDVTPYARPFPDGVPVLGGEPGGVLLRALTAADLPGVVEQCRDPDMVRWTTVPAPKGGYGPVHAEAFLVACAEGWRSGEQLGWAIEETARPGVFAGTIGLKMEEAGLAEVGFGLHPGARGRHVMSTALRLVRDHAFDDLGLATLLWRAGIGNWGSRRVAAAAGFRVEGAVRRLLVQRGGRVDGWLATMTADDPRGPLGWLDPPRLSSARLRLRPFVEADAARVTEACADPVTQHWLVSLPRPYTEQHALAFVEATRDLAARGAGMVWCLADAVDDRCLGSLGLEGLGGYDRRGELGYWAHPEVRGRGLVTEAVRLVTGWAEGTGLVDSLLVRVAAPNAASRRVAQAAGYREVGVLPGAEPLGDGTAADLVLLARP